MALRVDHTVHQGRPGVMYTASEAGFGLPLHQHHVNDETHDIECIEGVVYVWGQALSGAWWACMLQPGDCMRDIECSLPHAVGALGRATWFNAFRYGVESRLSKSLREDERHTEVDVRVDVPWWVIEACR